MGIEYKKNAGVICGMNADLPTVGQISSIFVVNGNTVLFSVQMFSSVYVEHFRARERRLDRRLEKKSGAETFGEPEKRADQVRRLSESRRRERMEAETWRGSKLDVAVEMRWSFYSTCTVPQAPELSALCH